MIYIVTLERNPFGLMPQFIEKLKAFKYWWKIMDNVWLIDTQISTEKLSDDLRSCLNKEDKLCVTQIKNEIKGQMTSDSWAWIKTSEENGDFDK